MTVNRWPASSKGPSTGRSRHSSAVSKLRDLPRRGGPSSAIPRASPRASTEEDGLQGTCLVASVPPQRSRRRPDKRLQSGPTSPPTGDETQFKVSSGKENRCGIVQSSPRVAAPGWKISGPTGVCPKRGASPARDIRVPGRALPRGGGLSAGRSENCYEVSRESWAVMRQFGSRYVHGCLALGPRVEQASRCAVSSHERRGICTPAASSPGA